MSGIFSTAFLMGGLGNQMFQIANAYAQALDNNVECFFRKSSQTYLQGFTPTKYLDNIYKKLPFVDTLPNNNFIRYSEPEWSYNDKKLDWSHSIEFYGYYQSSKNFLTYADKIKELFQPDSVTIDTLIKKYPQILEKNTLSIHLRFGDYLRFPNIHPVVSKSYIEKAIESIGNYSHLFVFSDDKNWVIQNLKYENTIYVDELDYIELWLMSLCANNVISNSTFSWWGSYLNKNKNKKIIAPSIWFNEGGPKNFVDVFEPNWLVLNVKNKNGELICY